MEAKISGDLDLFDEIAKEKKNQDKRQGLAQPVGKVVASSSKSRSKDDEITDVEAAK